jgi:WD40 repeat protein
MIFALGMSASTSAQDEKTPRLISATAVEDIAHAESKIRYVAISPDGKTIAWLDKENNQVCLLNLSDASHQCYPFAETLRHIGSYSAISWSPDSRYIATNESFFDQLYDSDIWVLDTTNGEMINRTDDHYLGSFLKTPDTAFADYLPTWNPANNDFYIFRTPPRAENSSGYDTNLYRLPSDNSDPILVQMLGVRLPTLSVYRPVSISPDGKQMAFLVLPVDYAENPATGLWVMNLADTQFKQIADFDAFHTGLPDDPDQKKQLIPNTLSWAGNDGLVVTTRDISGMRGFPQNSYYVSLSEEKVTPLLDFTKLTGPVEYFNDASQAHYATKDPRSGIATPDGKGFIYLGQDAGVQTGYIWWKALPPDSEEPVLLGKIADFKVTLAATAEPSINLDGTEAVLYGYLIKLAR